MPPFLSNPPGDIPKATVASFLPLNYLGLEPYHQAYGTTMVGLIKSAYREDVQQLTAWCTANSLSLNINKTKEIVVDFRRAQSDHSPLFIDGSSMEIVKSTKFLGIHLAENFSWSLKISSISKKAQQHLYFLWRLKKAHLPLPILTMVYRGTIKSILSSCITAWFRNCTVSDCKILQRTVKTAEKIISVSLPSITNMYTTCCIHEANSIVDDPTHPSHTLLTLLPSGKRYRNIRALTTRLCNSFFSQVIRFQHPELKLFRGGAAPPVVSGGEYQLNLAPTLPPLGEFQTPARRTSSPQSRRSSVDVARCECSAVDVAQRCSSAVDVAWPCCSAVDVTRLCGSAVDVVRRLRSVVDVALDPLALPSGPLLPPLVSLLLLTPPTCLALILVPPTCLALVLASPHSPCFCFSLPPQVPRPAPRSPHRPLYVPSSSPGPIAGPDFLGGAR
ncbi:hypothetical protein QTP86_016755, partial [Hemibagrus guttatus]